MEVAQEAGAGNLSLDAVAHRAGVSKGGLLYNFPSKAKLLQALVQHYLNDYETSFEREKAADGGTKSALQVHVQLSRELCDHPKGGASGVLAAMADDPHFLDPLSRFKRRILDRLKAEARDPLRALMCFLVLEGITSLDLFELNLLTEDERRQVLDRLTEEADGDFDAASN